MVAQTILLIILYLKVLGIKCCANVDVTNNYYYRLTDSRIISKYCKYIEFRCS